MMEEVQKENSVTEIEKAEQNAISYLQEGYDFSGNARQRWSVLPRIRAIAGSGHQQTRVSAQRPSSVQKSMTLPDPRTMDPQAAEREIVEEILNSGMLYKTSRKKVTSDLTRSQREHRQYRRFQLTEHSLEYSQLLQRVRDNHSYLSC